MPAIPFPAFAVRLTEHTCPAWLGAHAGLVSELYLSGRSVLESARYCHQRGAPRVDYGDPAESLAIFHALRIAEAVSLDDEGEPE